MRRALGDRYVIGPELARGGAARVFQAADSEGRRVAVKVLHPELVVTATAERFLREIRLLADMDHPRIARLLDYGELDWLVYYVTAYVEGPTLRQHLNQVRQASVADTVRLAAEALDALGYAHAREIVHRDVKPENIVLSPRGAVLMDFGIARLRDEEGERLTGSGTVGTSAYMSPEQVVASGNVDQRSDLYSLGCVLFECLAGQPPFEHPLDEVMMRMHLERRSPDVNTLRPDTPPGLAAIIAKALAKDREVRWASAAEMARAVAELQPG